MSGELIWNSDCVAFIQPGGPTGFHDRGCASRLTAPSSPVGRDLDLLEHRLAGPIPGLVIGPRSGRVLVFFHGFMAAPRHYRTLMRHLASHGTTVIAPQLYRQGPMALAGRSTAGEIGRAIEVVEGARSEFEPTELWLAGHSRGGQTAWGAAESTNPDGVAVLDPVDGSGPRPKAQKVTSLPAAFSARSLIVGAGLGERCAPAGFNHERFAAVAPPDTTHVLMPTMGHADLLDNPMRRAARWLCPGSDDPDLERLTLARIVAAFVDGRPLHVENGSAPLDILATPTGGENPTENS